MKIAPYIAEDRVISELQGTDKRSGLRELSQLPAKVCRVASAETIAQILLDREKMTSTGIGEGIAIPHGRVKGLKDFILCFARSTKGIDFDSSDHKPAHLFFLVLAPENSAAVNLHLLSRIVTLLKDHSFKKRLLEACSPKELFQIICDEDDKY
jgi:PTS system nitrogen regulatory IIA component